MDRSFCLGDQRRFFAGDSESVAGVIYFWCPTAGVAADKEAASRDWNMDFFDVVVGEFPWVVRDGFGGGSVFVWRRNGQDPALAFGLGVVGGGGSDTDKSVRDRGFWGGVESFSGS